MAGVGWVKWGRGRASIADVSRRNQDGGLRGVAPARRAQAGAGQSPAASRRGRLSRLRDQRVRRVGGGARVCVPARWHLGRGDHCRGPAGSGGGCCPRRVTTDRVSRPGSRAVCGVRGPGAVIGHRRRAHVRRCSVGDRVRRGRGRRRGRDGDPARQGRAAARPRRHAGAADRCERRVRLGREHEPARRARDRQPGAGGRRSRRGAACSPSSLLARPSSRSRFTGSDTSAPRRRKRSPRARCSTRHGLRPAQPPALGMLVAEYAVLGALDVFEVVAAAAGRGRVGCRLHRARHRSGAGGRAQSAGRRRVDPNCP